MQELTELRACIEQQRYPEALAMITEMEEMSREDKVNKIYSFVEVLLLHLIKQAAERRTTRSWDLSIRNAIRQIGRVNQRRKSGDVYVEAAELRQIIAESYQPALERAALEAFEGQYDEQKLAQMVNRDAIEQNAFQSLSKAQTS